VLGVILLAVLPSYGVARLAERKGRHFWTWFVMAVLVGWMFVLVAAIAHPPAGAGVTRSALRRFPDHHRRRHRAARDSAGAPEDRGGRRSASAALRG
jgi:hypothetical protein